MHVIWVRNAIYHISKYASGDDWYPLLVRRVLVNWNCSCLIWRIIELKILYQRIDLFALCQGSVCLLHKPLKALFVGDHIAMGESELCISEKYNWFSGINTKTLLINAKLLFYSDFFTCSLCPSFTVPIQVSSVRKLMQFDFEWILPGEILIFIAYVLWIVIS